MNAGRPVVSRLGRALLTLGAGLGVLCVLAALAAVVLGARPVVFVSGSMSPTYDVGTLGFARSVPATEVELGDVVTVPSGAGTVTHRVVRVSGGGSVLTLRGDANPEPDPTAYQVGERVDVVLLGVPHLGRAVDWLSGPTGRLMLGAYAFWLVSVLLRPRHRPAAGSGGTRRAPRRARGPVPRPRAAARVAATSAALVLVSAEEAGAAWTDGVVVQTVTPAAVRTVTPTPPTASCGPLQVGAVTLSWTRVEAATGYRLAYGGITEDVAATATSKTITSGSGTFSVRARFGSETWLSVPSDAKSYSVLLGLASTCG